MKVRVRLKHRPKEIVEVRSSELLDLQRWGLILEYVDDTSERVLTYDQLKEYFEDAP